MNYQPTAEPTVATPPADAPVGVAPSPVAVETNGAIPAPTQLPAALDPAMAAFAKITADLRATPEAPPVTVPFGRAGTPLRVYGDAPAMFMFDLFEAEETPQGAFKALYNAVIPEDRELFEMLVRLPPNDPKGITQDALLDFVLALAGFYGGAPLAS